MRRANAVYLCGGDFRPSQDRDSDCPSPLHDWPLPSGYVDAADEANRRLARHWSCRRCPSCHLYGWGPSSNVKGTTAEHWAPQTITSPARAALADTTEGGQKP